MKTNRKLKPYFSGAREESGLSQSRFAKIIRVSQASYSKIERGEQRPSANALIQLCQFVGGRKNGPARKGLVQLMGL